MEKLGMQMTEEILKKLKGEEWWIVMNM
jgi:hypothetical protein